MITYSIHFIFSDLSADNLDSSSDNSQVNKASSSSNKKMTKKKSLDAIDKPVNGAGAGDSSSDIKTTDQSGFDRESLVIWSYLMFFTIYF